MKRSPRLEIGYQRNKGALSTVSTVTIADLAAPSIIPPLPPPPPPFTVITTTSPNIGSNNNTNANVSSSNSSSNTSSASSELNDNSDSQLLTRSQPEAHGPLGISLYRQASTLSSSSSSSSSAATHAHVPGLSTLPLSPSQHSQPALNMSPQQQQQQQQQQHSVSPRVWNMKPPPVGPPPLPPLLSPPLVQEHEREREGMVPCGTFAILHALFKNDMDKKIAHAPVHKDSSQASISAEKEATNNSGSDEGEKMWWTAKGCRSAIDRYIQITRGDVGVAGLSSLGAHRSVRWLIFAGVISKDPEQWDAELSKKRSDYAIAKVRLLQTQAQQANDKETQRLRREIVEDVKRTRQTEALFTAGDTAELMARVLLVFAKTNPAVGYIQGMNEVLAVIVAAIWEDATAASMDFPGVFGSGCWEADAYALFASVMGAIQLSFTSEDIIVTRCQAVQLMLAGKDPELEHTLTDLGIQPQLYMLRWIRILFAQLYSLSDTIIIWDAILLFGLNSGIVEHICVTLLAMIRASSK